MAEITNIEWTDATVNFWWGCSPVSLGCDNCYAETWNNFRGNKQWGPGAPRRKIISAAASLRRLQKDADNFERIHGRRRRVFMHSMSDVFDNEVPAEWREEAFAAAEAADRLDIQFVTKRITNLEKLAPAHWLSSALPAERLSFGSWPRHIGVLMSVVTQREAERDIERLLKLKQRHRLPWAGISGEPLLEALRPRRLRVGKKLWLDGLTGHYLQDLGRGYTETIYHADGELPGPLPGLDWVIIGGESSKLARPMHPEWVRTVRDQCRAAGVPFLFKQWGEWKPVSEMDRDELTEVRARPEIQRVEGMPPVASFLTTPNQQMDFFKVGKSKAGRTLDRRIHNEFPRISA
ncbi:DUF5131 family protein [Ensifer sp. ENS04]|uniref:DUF5131 family protein n=1 Tax=Ensifer sp. ENS04 TaxID=2769281 RepID=UPI001785B5FB|nr:DUF5131 family protein [Ensifer sp. ENS04]MBD9539966.1 DUF5131 family protein [Ensifer sp. ENS04]